ncbi:MAG TPA: ArsR family transcriptional regulator [Anaerolineales bacterium]|nr:ArsR family transcriptional regulator [Anaerolineales bacterium]
MVTARQKVLTYFAKTRSASVREVSRALKMSAATVRHHLRVLVSDGRLEMTAIQKGGGKGRPQKMYSIPGAALGNNLSALSEALWTEAGSSVRVEALAERLAGESNFKDQVMSKRLGLVVEKLNQMSYHARWEAGAAGPRIIFGHCPYAAILAKRPELCKMDAALLKEMFGDEFEQIAKIENFQGVCIFVT